MSVGKNYFFNLIVTASNLAFPLIAFPYVSRVLQPSGIGQVQFAISFAQYFALVAALGIPIYGIAEVAKIRHNSLQLSKFFSELLLLHVFSTVICSLGYLIVVFNVEQLSQQSSVLSIGLFIPLTGILNFDWFYNGVENFRFIAIRTLFIKSLCLILLFVMVKSIEDISIYMIIMTALIGGDYVLNLFFAKKLPRFRIRGLEIEKHIMPLLFIFTTTLASSIYTKLDVVILGFYKDTTEVGFYTASSRISKASIPIITAFFAVIIPKVAKCVKLRDLKKEMAHMKDSFSFLAFFGIPISFGLFFLRNEIIYLFSGDTFLPAADSLLYLSALPLLIGAGYILAFQGLVPRGMNKSMFYASMGGLTAFILINIFFVPKYGHVGSAIAIVLTELIVTLGYLYFIPFVILKKVRWTMFLSASVISLGFYPILLLARASLGSNWQIVLVTIVLSALYYFFIQSVVLKNEMTKKAINTIIKR